MFPYERKPGIPFFKANRDHFLIIDGEKKSFLPCIESFTKNSYANDFKVLSLYF